MKDRPIVTDQSGTRRFKKNLVVEHLLTEASAGRKCALNDIWAVVYFHHQGDKQWKNDLREFYQMIGYSLDGYSGVFPYTKVRK